MTLIKISTEHFSFSAELDQSETARKFIKCLPISKKATMWGGELYFEVPFHSALEKDSQEEVPVGGLAYWPSGNMFCIFFGKTPASIGDIPRAVSPVNIFGQIITSTQMLDKVKNGETIHIELIC